MILSAILFWTYVARRSASFISAGLSGRGGGRRRVQASGSRSASAGLSVRRRRAPRCSSAWRRSSSAVIAGARPARAAHLPADDTADPHQDHRVGPVKMTRAQTGVVRRARRAGDATRVPSSVQHERQEEHMSAARRPRVTGTAVRRFEIGFDESELSDLRRRIGATSGPSATTVNELRLPGHTARDHAGTSRATGRSAAPTGDGRARLNALPNFLTEIDGLNIRFHPRPLSPRDALPADRHARLARLDHRAAEDHRAAHDTHCARRHRGRRVPSGHPHSLPGHGFSAKPAATGWDPMRPGPAPTRC